MKKIRYTTYVSEKHLKILRELATETQLPIALLIGNAIDSYLTKIKRLSRPEFAPINMDFLEPINRELQQTDNHQGEGPKEDNLKANPDTVHLAGTAKFGK